MQTNAKAVVAAEMQEHSKNCCRHTEFRSCRPQIEVLPSIHKAQIDEAIRLPST